MRSLKNGLLISSCLILLTAFAAPTAHKVQNTSQKTKQSSQHQEKDPFASLLKRQGPSALRLSSNRAQMYQTIEGDERFVLKIDDNKAWIKFICDPQRTMMSPTLECAILQGMHAGEEVYLLTAQRSPRGDVIYRDSQGIDILRLTANGGATLYNRPIQENLPEFIQDIPDDLIPDKVYAEYAGSEYESEVEEMAYEPIPEVYAADEDTAPSDNIAVTGSRIQRDGASNAMAENVNLSAGYTNGADIRENRAGYQNDDQHPTQNERLGFDTADMSASMAGASAPAPVITTPPVQASHSHQAKAKTTAQDKDEIAAQGRKKITTNDVNSYARQQRLEAAKQGMFEDEFRQANTKSAQSRQRYKKSNLKPLGVQNMSASNMASQNAYTLNTALGKYKASSIGLGQAVLPIEQRFGAIEPMPISNKQLEERMRVTAQLLNDRFGTFFVFTAKTTGHKDPVLGDAIITVAKGIELVASDELGQNVLRERLETIDFMPAPYSKMVLNDKVLTIYYNPKLGFAGRPSSISVARFLEAEL